ncbi:hypothetical protein Toil_gp04 [Rhodococcus phage Toil]|uniref:Uncharacterized protein n=1 Tax=Rhodococcus phage Toil TaxID=1975614 RepID=A0A1W6DXG0_9VIRU|nr:hypothetical protein KMD62_gp04 [Rhodococcus phage Toil]ARK07687.1 hypothetical protein Toil_gp04 [Rhodococcus phage Toil]
MAGDSLASKVDDMFAWLTGNVEKFGQGTIECQPEAGTEGEVVTLFFAHCREAGYCVHLSARHEWLLFHAHLPGTTAVT